MRCYQVVNVYVITCLVTIWQKQPLQYVEPDLKRFLEQDARKQGKKLSDLLQERLIQNTQGIDASIQTEAIKRENQHLRERLERITGKKTKIEKRVSVGLTLSEYDSLSNVAHKFSVSKSEVLRRIISSREFSGKILAGQGPLSGHGMRKR